ncbi:hypothetical protein PR048_013508 [Dryococelus australis]|uniref:Transposase n=1 Tax=Dryococelus australis TaxID=614101 RepID=A0ABQ9HSD7_9NEOP|nr:hypothetical protein PR048_013508 [Dryococelus australis]
MISTSTSKWKLLKSFRNFFKIKIMLCFHAMVPYRRLDMGSSFDTRNKASKHGVEKKVTLLLKKVNVSVSWQIDGYDFFSVNQNLMQNNIATFEMPLYYYQAQKSLKTLLQNCAPTQNLLNSFKWEIFGHPPHSPDLTPSDFHLLPYLKTYLEDVLQMMMNLGDGQQLAMKVGLNLA